MKSTLAVMARYPVVGQVKTRLARAVGAEGACDLYRAFLRDIGVRFTGGRRPLVWLFHPPDCDFAALVGTGARCLPQDGRDLGERMYNAFRCLSAEGIERIIMIGADVPHVRHEWLDAAEELLGSADVVLGPSEDGGYYLVAMQKSHDLFTGIAMGRPEVLAETLARANMLALRVHLLPKTFDVDERSDLARLRRLLKGARAGLRLPHTLAVLDELERQGRKL